MTVVRTETVTAASSKSTDTKAPPPAKSHYVYHRFVRSDFAVSLRIKSKSCFGSAGCNIEFEINPHYIGKFFIAFTASPASAHWARIACR